MDFFISYNTKDKVLAGRVGKLLEREGQKPFLAHDDIRPTEDWENEILQHLDTCNVLIALITPNFSGSDYANQEVGIIMGKGKLVIPLRLDESHLPGFIKSSQAIPASEASLDNAVTKAIQTAEERVKAAFVRPRNITSASGVIDARLEQRNEPYWRVSVSPQGGYSSIPKTGNSDKWVLDVQNLPQLLTYMQGKPMSNGWTFTSNGPRFAELTEQGEFSYGFSIGNTKQVSIQKGIQLLSESIGYVIKLMDHFNLKSQTPGIWVYPQLKLGRSEGLSLSIALNPGASDEESNVTDREEVMEGGVVSKDEWQKDQRSSIERIIIQFSRSFGISLDDLTARILVTAVLAKS